MMDSAANIISLDQAPSSKGNSGVVPGMDNQGRSEDSFSNVYRQEQQAQNRSEVPGKKRSEEVKNENNRVPEKHETQQAKSEETDKPQESAPKQVAEKAEGKGPQQAAERMEEKVAEEKEMPENANASNGQEQANERHALLAELFKRMDNIENSDISTEQSLDELPLLPDQTEVLLEAGEDMEIDTNSDVTEVMDELEDVVEEQQAVAVPTESEKPKQEEVITPELEEPIVASPLAQAIDPETVVESETEIDNDDLARRVASRADLLQQNTKQVINEKVTQAVDVTEDEIIEEAAELDEAVQETLKQLERSSTKFEAVLAAKHAQQNQTTASELFQQLTDKIALQSNGERPLLSALGAAQQPGAGMRAQNPAAMPTYVMDTPVESEQWGHVFSKRINFLVKNNVQLAELRLDPPEMGRVNIKIKMGQDGSATIHFNAQHVNVREAIETAVPRLRELLNEGGIGLGNVDVSTQFSQHQNENQGHFEARLGKAAFPQQGDGDAGTDMDETAGGMVRQISADSLVDFYA